MARASGWVILCLLNRRDLREQRSVHCNTLARSLLASREPPRAGSRAPGTPSIQAASVAKRSSVAAECGRVDRDDICPVPGGDPPHRGTKSPRREFAPVKPAGKELDHQGQRGALGIAQRHHGSVQRRRRVGGRLAVGVERPAFGDRLAPLPGGKHIAARHLRQRQVDDDRRPARRADRQRRSGWCRTPPGAAPGRDRAAANWRTSAPRDPARRGARRDGRPRRNDATGGWRRRRCPSARGIGGRPSSAIERGIGEAVRGIDCQPPGPAAKRGRGEAVDLADAACAA